ncbi:MAG: NIPSNAP family protein [Blastocatellia bacterium]
MPHLIYLVGFDNMAAREKVWDTFRANPDWARMRNKPGWTDPAAVSNIHAALLLPPSQMS